TGRSGSVGKVFFVNEDFWPLNTTLYVRDFHGNEPRFVFHLLNHFNLQRFAGGAGVPTLNRNDVHGESVFVPSDVQEQQRIVAILDETFEAIAAARANAEQNRQNARALFESYLQSVFSQRGNGWVEKTLGDIGKVSMCKRVLKEQTSAIGDIPFYKIGSFGKKADSFISTELYSQYKEKYSFPKKGDILLSAAGTIGRRVIFDGNDAYFQDSNIVWIANDQTQVLNCFLYHFYGACEWNATKGATILRLYNDDLRRIVIAFPTSLDVQKSIAAQMDLIFDATQRLESLYQRKIAALDELKQSLLQQAFSGQL
ncbi:restriction endonuclease subunit S, partial [Aeromonas veronii bv. sobria]